MKFDQKTSDRKYFEMILISLILIFAGVVTAGVSDAMTRTNEGSITSSGKETAESFNSTDIENEGNKENNIPEADVENKVFKITNSDAVSDKNGNYIININSVNASDTIAGTDMVKDGNIIYRRINFIVRKSGDAATKPVEVKVGMVKDITKEGEELAPELPAVFFGNAIYRGADGVKTDAKTIVPGTEYYFYIPVSDMAASSILHCSVNGIAASGENETIINNDEINNTYVTLNMSKWFNLG